MSSASLRFDSPPRHSFWGQGSPAWQRWLAGALLLLGVAGLGGLIAQALQDARDTQALTLEVAVLEAASAARPAASATLSKAPAQPLRRALSETQAAGLSDDTRRHLNTVIRQLNTPWQDLFYQLESLTPADVALLSIEPDARRRTIKLQAEARTLDALLVYASSLEHQGVLGRLTYSKYEINEQDSNKPTRLSFELELRTPERLAFPQKDALVSEAPALGAIPADRMRKP